MLFISSLFIVILLICTIVSYLLEDTRTEDINIKTNILLSLPISTIVTIAIFLFFNILMLDNYNVVNAKGDELVVEEEVIYEIQALEDNYGVDGGFFLGIGGVQNNLSYYVMAKEKEGVILKEINPKLTIVIEDNNETPRYVLKKEYAILEKKDNILTYVTSEFTFADRKRTLKNDDYILYIPEGSITKNYDIDLR